MGLTTASRAVVFLYGAPFFVALGAHYLLPDDRLTPAKAAGLAVAFGGLVLAFAEGLRQPTGEDALLGDALCLLGGALWAATTVLVKGSRLRGAPPVLTLQYQLVVSAPLLLLASPLLGEATAVSLTPVVALAFLYQAVGVAFISYTAWFWLVSRHSASRLAAFSVLTPIFGVLAGAALLGDRLGSSGGASPGGACCEARAWAWPASASPDCWRPAATTEVAATATATARRASISPRSTPGSRETR